MEFSLMNADTMTLKELCGMIDHTYLAPNATNQDILKLCREAKDNGFAMVAVNSVQVALCKKYLRDTPVHVGAAVSFPLGQTTIPVKVFETQDAINEGADEIDYVINISALKEHNYQYIQKEMEQIVDICRSHSVISKVIFENCYLEDQEIVELVKIANAVQSDFVKTSTGFGTSGATVHDIKLMKSNITGGVKIKAAGGIHNWSICKEMIKAGAERIGTTHSFDIIESWKQAHTASNGG